jgi:hypothetical protein
MNMRAAHRSHRLCSFRPGARHGNPTGTVTTPAGTVGDPNGIVLTPDGSESFAGGSDAVLLRIAP